MAIPTVIVSSVADTRVPGLTPTSASTIEDFTRGLMRPSSFSCCGDGWLVQAVYTLGTQLYPGVFVTGPSLSKWNRVLRARWGFWRCQDSGGSRTSASQVSPVMRLGISSEKTTFPLCVCEMPQDTALLPKQQAGADSYFLHLLGHRHKGRVCEVQRPGVSILTPGSKMQHLSSPRTFALL